MTQFLKAAFSGLPAVASSPYALVAYLAVIAAWVVIAWRVKRNSNLLQSLGKLPPRDRLKALQAEMGSVQLASGLSPEQWLRSRVHLYYFLGFAVVILSFVILFVVAATSQLSGTVYIGIAIIAFTVLLLVFLVRRIQPSRTVEVDITPFNDSDRL
jgi:hypothetical protein